MKSFYYAIKQIVPCLMSYIFVGMASGILLKDAGYSTLWAFIAGATVYSGSMQIVMVSMLTSHMPLFVIAITAFFIAARHIFYGIGFIEEFRAIGKKSFWKYPYMALTMTDETYSVLCSLECPDDVDKEKVQFYILLLCHMLFITSCTLGALLGDVIPFDLTGIDFSATAFFTAVVVNQWSQFKSHIPAITGLISAALFYMVLGADHFILPALSLSLIVLVIMKDRTQLKMGGVSNE
jgi:4-azaleucine resistance transporter AzlC